MSPKLLKRPRVGIPLAGALLIAVSVFDYLSGPDIAFSLFYILVVAYVSWLSRNRQIALASAMASAIAWLTVDWLTLGHEQLWVVVWNAGTRLAILVTIGLVISRLHRALDAEKALSRTDFLTGLLNSRALEETARAEVLRARRLGHPLSVVYVDLDDFKGVNDRLGHVFGDSVLREVAQVLRSSVRATDSVARVGGDEFVLLLPATGGDHSIAVLEKVRAALADAMVTRSWNVTCSMGVVSYATPPEDYSVLVRAADALMYRAKAEGKNRMEIAESAA